MTIQGKRAAHASEFTSAHGAMRKTVGLSYKRSVKFGKAGK